MTARSSSCTGRALLALAAVALVAGCSTTSVDKHGAPVPAATELVLGTADPGDPDLPFFVEAVDRLSDHRLRVRVDSTTYNSETPGGEAKLVGDLREGAVPLGWVPSRDLADHGIPAFVALHTPFLVPSTSDAVTLAVRPEARAVLADLDEFGFHGVALVPAESRRLLSRRPVLSLRDLAGLRVRIKESQQTAGLVTAWSAVPVDGVLALKARDDLSAGQLDAVESAPLQILRNNYVGPAPYLSSFGLLPKFQAVVLGTQAWSRLSDADRATLESAGAQTVAHAAQKVAGREARELSQLCARGLVVVRPTAAALDTLRGAASGATPAADPTWVARLRAALADPGRSDTPAVPPDCPVATSAADARAIHARTTATPSQDPKAAADFPVGSYVTKVTSAQWKAADTGGTMQDLDVTFTSTFNPDGTFTQTQVPNPPDQGPYSGTWSVSGNRLTVDYHPDSDSGQRFLETVTWSYFRGVLQFVVVAVPDDGSKVMYRQPWRRTG